MYTIQNYSIDDNYTYSNKGTNTSHIITAMIHLAGRLCEHYASDIVFDANSFREAIKNDQPYDKVLFFRECGVTTLRQENIDCIKGTEYLQSWRLIYNPETQDQIFTRVYIREESDLK